ncbi:FadR/GntR family transcriptional regulator [Lederbergia citrea]|uniref:FadR/GntR family transcriptional regulator n=1 Tax=Lederbergia citrea TaxID=2833581 RepID=UPI001BC98077|nr:FadR family transcriptional regulator [Lederbergia citrea]MBS4202617.1 FadR family transcriptional regulator [Lederbergia citrea]
MDNHPGQSKVYFSIVKAIRKMITADGLQPGDKIPSERELSERLKVGRSSVREALRSLELLGLIETRRGEGTFLRNFKNHHLIKLLGMFILEDPHVKKDIFSTKELLEKDIIRLMSSSPAEETLKGLRVEAANQPHQSFEKMMELTNNRLLYRIWEILNDFSNEAKDNDENPDPAYVQPLMEAIIDGDAETAIAIYDGRV